MTDKNIINKSISALSLLAVSAIALSACTGSQLDRLKNVGKEPSLEVIKNPKETGEPVTWPVARAYVPPPKTSTDNSLFSDNTRSFFGDSRAREEGDILMVQIAIKDKAELDNKTERTRNSSDSVGAPSLFGVQNKLASLVSGETNPANLVSINGALSNTGEGIIEREEVIETEVAAVVRQVLPNGNLVIYGSQEVRVNHEVRVISIEGVVRTSDITPNNTITSSRIAEARISYGGRGLISDVQQPRLGSQIVDIVSPF